MFTYWIVAATEVAINTMISPFYLHFNKNINELFYGQDFIFLLKETT
jgi:hypothetical protein